MWDLTDEKQKSILCRFLRDVPPRMCLFQICWIWYLCTNSSKNIFFDPSPNPLDLVWMYKFLQKYPLDPKDLLLNDTLVYLRRNLVCKKVQNLIRNLTESSLKEKIQDQSVSTHILDSLSVLTQQLAFSKSCLLAIVAKISYQISWPMTLAPTFEAIRCETSG